MTEEQAKALAVERGLQQMGEWVVMVNDGRPFDTGTDNGWYVDLHVTVMFKVPERTPNEGY